MTTPRPHHTLGYDPAVTTWRIAMAPRPRFTTNGRHWWRDTVTDAWECATHAWALKAEEVTIGYKTEMAEYRESNPPPRLKDFMVELSRGGLDPDPALDRQVTS